MALFYDNTAGANDTFYWDDVEFISAPVASIQMDTPVTFDDHRLTTERLTLVVQYRLSLLIQTMRVTVVQTEKTLELRDGQEQRWLRTQREVS